MAQPIPVGTTINTGSEEVFILQQPLPAAGSDHPLNPRQPP